MTTKEVSTPDRPTPETTLKRLERAAMRWYREWLRLNPEGEQVFLTGAEKRLVNAAAAHAKGRKAR